MNLKWWFQKGQQLNNLGGNVLDKRLLCLILKKFQQMSQLEQEKKRQQLDKKTKSGIARFWLAGGSKLNSLGFPGKQSKSATHESPKESPFQLSNKQINTMFSLNVLSKTQ